MGYYIRVLGKNLTTIPAQELRDVALPAVVDVAESSGDMWEQVTLKHKSGQEIAMVERNPVAAGKLGADELQEFLDEVPHHKPDSAAAWLQEYLPTVKVIYAFQLLSGTDAVAGHRVPILKGVYRHFASNTMSVRDASLRAATSSIGGQGRAKHDRVRFWSSDIAEGMWSHG